LAAEGFGNAIDRANTTCRSQRNLAFAQAVVALQEFALYYFPPNFDLTGVDLDGPTVRDQLCVRMEIVSATFPPPPYPAGQPQTLQVQARITFPGSGQPALTSPIQVEVNGQGVAEADATGFVTRGPADSQGLFSTTVTPTGNAPVVLRVRARINDPAFPGLFAIFAEALVFGGLEVSPSSVTLAPGETQQFTATLNGQPHAVTWSVSGAVATITPQGLFTASTPPTLPVTVVVTATSTTSGQLTGTALVTIQGTSGGALLLPRSGFAQADQADEDEVCHDQDTLAAGAVFPAEVSAECPRSAVRLTATLSGAGIATFTATARASVENSFDGQSQSRADLVFEASRDLNMTVSLNAGWATLTGLEGRCRVDTTVSFNRLDDMGDTTGDDVAFRQRTGLPPEESDLTRTFTLPAGQVISVFVELVCRIVNEPVGTAAATGNGMVATVTFSPAP